MKKPFIALLALALPAAAFGADAPAQKVEPIIKLETPAPAAKPTLSENQQAFYGLGVWLAQKVDVFHLTAEELKTVESGLRDAILGKKLQVDLNAVGPKIQELAQKRMQAAADKEKQASKTFIEKAGKEKGAKILPSGLIYKSLTDGKGDSPKASDTVKVNYEGKLLSGKVFDSSYERHEPASFGLAQVIPCWTEGLQQMKPGGKAQLVCPSNIAYGDAGHPPSIPGGATLVFTVELLEIEKPDEKKPEPKAAEASPARADQKAAVEKAAKEKGAVKLPSGVVYLSLKDGSGASPKATDTVKVHYKGTLTDGKTFDSSYDRHEPAEFPLNGVIPCWTEGVQKIKVGGKAKLTCPAATAYGDHGPPGIGNGSTLTFEVELLDIKK